MNGVIGEKLSQVAETQPNQAMVVWEDRVLTYGEVDKLSDDLAKALLDIGIRKGDRVTTWLTNEPGWVIVFFALAKIGAVTVSANTRFKSSEIEYILKHSESRALIMMDRLGSIDFIEILNEVVPEFVKQSPGALETEVLPELKNIICLNDDVDGTWGFNELLERGRSLDCTTELHRRKLEVSPSNTAMFQYTSGTTGFPKGAVLLHGAIIQNGIYTSQRLGVTDKSRWFSAMPFYHVGGNVWGLMTCLVRGATLVTQRIFEAEQALRLMEHYRCTHAFGVDTMFISEINHSSFEQININLEAVVTIGSPELLKEIKQAFGARFISSMWGLTESTGNATLCDINEDPLEKQLTTVGKPHLGYEIAVINAETGEKLPPGEKGELCIRGPMVMNRYFKMPEQTHKTIDEHGWLHTGDIGTYDEDGFYYFVGRIKDMIKPGGENVAAAEVEGYIMGHPKVKMAQMIGVPDPRLNEVGAVYIELHRGETATEDEIIEYCEGSIADFKVPRYVWFVKESDWPMTGSGKIQKYILEEQAKQELGYRDS